MAKWKRRKSRTVPAGLNRYYSLGGHMIRPWEDDSDDGATAGIGRPGCGDTLAPSAELASCAPELLEEGDAPQGETDGAG